MGQCDRALRAAGIAGIEDEVQKRVLHPPFIEQDRPLWRVIAHHQRAFRRQSGGGEGRKLVQQVGEIGGRGAQGAGFGHIGDGAEQRATPPRGGQGAFDQFARLARHVR